MPDKPRTPKKPRRLTFEQAAERLSEITAALEGGIVTLDESVELYREGVELTLYCDNMLKSAEKEVMTLRRAADGGAEEVPFEE